MSSPVFGFSPWRRRRSSSILSQPQQQITSPGQNQGQQPLSQDDISITPLSLSRSAQSSGANNNNSNHNNNNNDGPSTVSISVSPVGHREPTRSFIHGSVRDKLRKQSPFRYPAPPLRVLLLLLDADMEDLPAPVDSVQSALTVREDTAELATYFLSVKKDGASPAFLSRPRSLSTQTRQERVPPLDLENDIPDGSTPKAPEPIEEVSEPASPEALDIGEPSEGPSMLATMLRRSPPEDGRFLSSIKQDQVLEENFLESGESDGGEDGEADRYSFRPRPVLKHHGLSDDPSEVAPLIPVVSRESLGYGTTTNGNAGAPWNADLESQKTPNLVPWKTQVAESVRDKRSQLSRAFRVIRDPKLWDKHQLWEHLVVAPLVCLPAVIVGLLLNILDALSYGL